LLILAVDTTTLRGSAAIVENQSVVGEVRLISRDQHSRRILPAIEFLLGSLGIGPNDVKAYAVTIGPGSFTGLRVGLSTVQGLALASGRACIGVPTLDVLATRIRGVSPELVAMVDAYRDQVYAAVYDIDARLRGSYVVEAPESFLRRVSEGAAFIGDGAQRSRAKIHALQPKSTFPERSLYLAGTLGVLAHVRLEAGQGVAPEALRPLYLRPAEIRKPSP